MILVSSNIRFMRIFVGIPWSGQGGVKRHWGCRKRQFPVLSVAISSEALELMPKLYSII